MSNLFNYILGEELLFREESFPKMCIFFGRWDWLANTVLLGPYHLHKPWNIPSPASVSPVSGVLLACMALQEQLDSGDCAWS